ncbi:MAG: efflux transporter outer membrane subunit, partial [Methylococcaceae bacterium]|nr:efflux transporter outer membrane subunit [Methylococcaceae bacterium]
MKRVDRLGSVVAAAILAGCGSPGGLLVTVGPDYRAPVPPVASRWHAGAEEVPVAHGGDPQRLERWWERFDDPALNRFLAAAQRESASLAQARARIQQARAGRVGALAAALPTLDTSLQGNHSAFSFGGPVFERTLYQWDVQSSWEVDLFGGLARQREAAQSQLESRQASWHDARVAVAVEVANAYLAYRYCEVQSRIAEADAESRNESARLLGISGAAGFTAPADVALARAAAADGSRILLRYQSECEGSIKGLVAMTGLGEGELRRLLTRDAERQARLPEPPPFQIDALPARMLLQRPDVAAAERQVAEASANIGVEEAQRYPRLSLTGNIAHALQNLNAASLLFARTWSVGPTLSLPLFDAGKRAANVDVARAQYEAAAAQFREAARRAVREVEEALVRLDSASRRLPRAREAEAGYQASFDAARQRYQAGLGSLLDSE